MASRHPSANPITDKPTQGATLQRVLLFLILLVEFVPMTPGKAQLPGVNLGATSFLDGMPPPGGPGVYLEEYFQYYYSTRLLNGDGNQIALPTSRGTFETPRVQNWIWLNQVFYQSNQQILPWGGRWGLSLTLPVVAIDISPDDFIGFQAKTFSLGDLFFGPFIQWDPIIGKHGPIFAHRLELDAVFPTGSYDSLKQVNAASNLYSFNPYWAGTLFLHPRWNVSWRLHYLWNSRNPDTDVQPGQAIHLNFATSFEIIQSRMHLGANGYWLQQITDSNIDGVDIPNSREGVIGIGPGALYAFSRKDVVFFNTYWEVRARNRTEGVRINLRWIHKF
ncbi:MAG TPA: transporter [Terrimicrobiaceae bacterium]